MKLKYSILWIEDNPKSIRRDKGKIIEYITDLGFECVDGDDVKVITSLSDFRDSIGCQKTSDFDLLLVDLDLGRSIAKNEGEYIIREIRKEKVFSEIVFYSAHYEDLSAKLNANFVEGVFTSSRDELVDKVVKIVDVTIKKTQDVNNLRGLIMAEVAELDVLKEEIILKASSLIGHQKLEKYTLDKVKKSAQNNSKKADSHLSNLNSSIKCNASVARKHGFTPYLFWGSVS